MDDVMGIRVVVADDHGVIRSGVKALLEASGLDVVAETGDGRELLSLVRDHDPEIALVDLSMPLLDGFEAIRRIPAISPETRVIVLSMHDDEGYVARAGALGAWAYVTKDEAPDRLIDVIRCVAGGTRLLPKADDVAEELTPREREVLQLIAEGRKNAEIAGIMKRSVHTVRNHRARLMRKLGVRSASELIDVAIGRKLICPGAGRRPG